ncbi:hypothetical protein F8388_002191 [Cannabis sativa]|uniref:Uncharacterized protein n=1 Tax=Cannabis sativa TaxID=3483 RepID=A0A7J6G3L5_CANSA|nr:hypothetical protein F8388_002191 [Cannabis sativa]KAF4377448.1 hypothetical protein G4B88_026401 [Cannabis sativa]
MELWRSDPGFTIVYTFVCLADTPSEPSDFFPLSVFYQERFSAAGRTRVITRKRPSKTLTIVKKTRKSTRYFNGFDIRLLDLFFRDCNGKNSILHCSFDLIHFRILRKPEPPHELPAAPLHPVPRVVLIFLLNVPLSADVEDSIIFDLHFHLFLLQPRNIGSEHVGLRSLLPVHSGIDNSRVFLR